MLGFLLSFFSCEEKVNRNSCNLPESKDSYSFILSENEEISFELDSVTSTNINYLKLAKLNDTLYFTFLNPYNNNIYCYNYESKKLAKKIPLSNPKKLSAYEILDWDKILTYQYWTYELNLQDGKGNILENVVVPLQNGSNGYYAFPNTHSPLIYNGSSIYLAGGHMSDKKAENSSHVVAQIDTTLSNIDYLYHYPKIYTEMFFGGVNYRMDISYVYNSDSNLFVFSFPASHKLYSTKDFKTENEYCAGSSYFNEIEEYPYDTPKKSFEYLANNGFYYSILYDKYNNLYYRICLLPTETEYKEGDVYSRDMSVIILDSEFNIVGEKLFKNGEDYDLGSISSICVSPDGLLIQQKNDLIEESQVNFNVYKLIKQ